jgi:enhancing lycopene biosynthesis protein 2
MSKRVGVVLSGCGHRDGTEVREAVLALLSLERAGAQIVFAAPDVTAPSVIDHGTGAPAPGAPNRAVLAEAARIARGPVRPLGTVEPQELDALVFPGGGGVGSVLSNYADKGALCDVHPDVARLLKAMLAARRPMGFICLAPILAARVLGPVAGVRLTLGSRTSAAAKHAAVMGADVRPCAVADIMVDQKHRVVSTPAYMYEDASLPQVAHAIERLVRTVISLGHARAPGPGAGPRPPGPPAPGARPQAAPEPPRPEGAPLRRRPDRRPAP